jgi:prophage endopeptidase
MKLSWKIGAVAALVGALTVGHTVRVRHACQAGYDTAVSERAARDAVAVITRTQDNAALAIKQDNINHIITKVKNEELAPVRERIVIQRVHVGTAICGPAATPEAESAAGSDRADPPGRLVREDVDRDIRALKLAVEEGLATGRACQAFLVQNGLVP